jgi:hypothetical protein
VTRLLGVESSEVLEEMPGVLGVPGKEGFDKNSLASIDTTRYNIPKAG